jgi:predicted Zn-dependent protease with MMP-like domain/Flp pilus assembly protein TadD
MPSDAGRAREEELGELLDDMDAAHENGDFEAVLSFANRALALDPRSSDALLYQAAAQVELGRTEDAARTYASALAVAPDDPEALLAVADFQITVQGDDRGAVEEGLALCAKGRKLARKQKVEDLEFELALLEGIGLNQIGESGAALKRLDEALGMAPSSVEARLERAVALFELCRFEAAEGELWKIVRAAEDEAWAHHYLGLIHERRGEAKEARRAFGRAHALAPEEFPHPVKLAQAEFDGAVADAVERLPEHVKAYLENTTIAVEPIPSDEDLTSSEPPLSPTILGIFRGTPVGERSVQSAADHFPAAIVLYQNNLERFAKTREELLEQIGITLMHEVGHLIGLDEEDLWERGLD